MLFRAASVLAAAGVMASGCRAANPGEPSPLLAGRWTGVMGDSVAGTGDTTLTMEQRGPGVSGSWSVAFANPALNRHGTISGTQRGTQISLFLTPRDSVACPSGVILSGTLGFTGTLAGGRLSGTYVVFACDGAVNGSLDLTRTGDD
jgi:hypothetical protein